MSNISRSKLWFLVHSWLALPIWFFVAGVTGHRAGGVQALLERLLAPAPAHSSWREDFLGRLSSPQRYLVESVDAADPVAELEGNVDLVIKGLSEA